MKKNGFTLIELLAVIVILAVIAIIVTPVVTGIITKTKLSADMRSAEGYVKAAEGFYANSLINENKKSKIGTNISNEVEVSGQKPNGDLVVSDKGKVSMAVIINNKCYRKYEETSEITVDENADSCHTAVVPPDRCFSISPYLEDKGGIAISKYLCGDSVATVEKNYSTYNNDGEFKDIIIPETINGYKVVGLDGYSFAGRTVGDKVGIRSLKLLSGGISTYSIYHNEVEYIDLSSNDVEKIPSLSICFNNQIKYIKIPGSVTKIPGIALAVNHIDTLEFENGAKNLTISSSSINNNHIKNLTLPENLVSMGQGAFANNELTSVHLPSKITELTEDVFENNFISSINLDNITKYGPLSLANNKLTNVDLSKASSIGTGAFNGNLFDDEHAYFYAQTDTNGNGILEESEKDKTILAGYAGAKRDNITIPSSVTIIGENAFNSSYINSVTIPSKVSTIGKSAFLHNNLTSIDIPETITSLGAYSFSYNKLASVTIPSSITTLETAVFASNPLTSVTIPNSITTIKDMAFDYTNLSDLTIPNSVTSLGDCLFRETNFETINIPNSVKTIATGAFYGIPNLKTINVDKASGSITGSPWGADTSTTTVNWLR